MSDIPNAQQSPKSMLLTPIKVGILKSWRLISLSHSDPFKHAQYLNRKYGNVVMHKDGKTEVVHLFAAEANRLALLNPDNMLSNKKGWDKSIGRLFPNGLMLGDAEDHHYHRRLMQAGFKSKVMQGYLSKMAPQIEQAIAVRLATAGNQQLLTYPLFKNTTVDLSATVFLGVDLGADARKINKAFEAIVAASMWRFPLALPGTLLRRGIRARQTICDFFQPLIEEQKTGDAQDLFSILCLAQNEGGNCDTDQEIVDHINFLTLAVHDMTASASTRMT